MRIWNLNPKLNEGTNQPIRIYDMEIHAFLHNVLLRYFLSPILRVDPSVTVARLVDLNVRLCDYHGTPY